MSNSAIPWTAACRASLSITNSWSLLKLMSIESVMPSNHLILIVSFSSRLQSFPASGSFQMSQLFASGGQSIGVSASASVFPMNIQGWFPLGLTGWISLQSKDSQESSPTPQFKSHFFHQWSFIFPKILFCDLLADTPLELSMVKRQTVTYSAVTLSPQSFHGSNSVSTLGLSVGKMEDLGKI